MPSRPNILLITLDQWRADALGEYTPTLSALAQEATVFTRHYSQAFPCGPARASLMTGLYAEQHRVRRNDAVLAARHATIFQILRGGGYDPTLFGYTDVSDESDELDARHDKGRCATSTGPQAGRPAVQCNGLNVNTSLNEDAALWIAHLRAKGYVIPAHIRHRDEIFALRRFDEPALFAAEHSEAAFLTDRFLQWLPTKEGGSHHGEPFCAHISYISPHPPFATPAPFDKQHLPSERHAPCRGDSPDIEAAQHPFTHDLLLHVNARKFAPGLQGLAQAQSLDTIQRIKAVYAGQVSQVDAQLGRLFDALRTRGQWDTTVIIVTADHGEQLFDHWLLGKTGYFDQSAHIPLLIRLPQAAGLAPSEHKDHAKRPARGRRVNAFTESIDIFPTLIALAHPPADGAPHGAPHVPAHKCDPITSHVGTINRTAPAYEGAGRDLLPWCMGETPALWRDEVHWQFDFSQVANGRLSKGLALTPALSTLDVVRTDRLKYVHFAGMPPVLFDLQSDPFERINRAPDAAMKALLAEGHTRWETWRDALDD